MVFKRGQKGLKPSHVVLLIFFVVLLIRLYFAFQVGTFTGDESYFHIRQVDSILKTGLPEFKENMAYSERTLLFPAFFHYLLSILALVFTKTFALKLFTNIFAASLVIFVYLVAHEISNNRTAALLSSFASGFIPVFFSETVNSVSTVVLVLPVIFYMIYCFMKIDSKKHLYTYLVLVVLLPLISPIAFLFIFGLFMYLILTRLEYQKFNRKEVELILFSTFIVLWIELLIFKRAFLFHSYAVIWQNIPQQILIKYFSETTLLEAIYQLGIVPLFFGLFTIYKYALKEKNRKIYLLIGFAMTVALLLWLRLIRPEVGLMFEGVILILLFSQSFKEFSNYIDITKAADYKSWIVAVLVLMIILTSVIPSIEQARKSVDTSLSDDEVAAFEWIRENTPKDSVILATVEEGNFITEIAQRRVVADTNFLLVRDPNIILEDIDSMYSTVFATKAIDFFDKYGVDYIVLSDYSKNDFGVEDLKYVEGKCFDLVYDEHVKVYRSNCQLKDKIDGEREESESEV